VPQVTIIDRDRIIDTPDDEPILFTLWTLGITISSICNGNCSCGTCSIEVLEGLEHCPAPNEGEAAVLAKIKRQGPNVRLACQLAPKGDVVVKIKPTESE
jgi:ferredoxin